MEKTVAYAIDQNHLGIKIDQLLSDLYNGIYNLRELSELIDSSIYMQKSSIVECQIKTMGGMEEWAKGVIKIKDNNDITCDWYHQFWPYFRLLNMVAVPKWYPFYIEAITSFLQEKPEANVFISACADYGMLAKLHKGIEKAKAKPNIVIHDICRTPLLSSKWYAERHNLKIDCHVNDIINGDINDESFDLIVTDEFLSVLKSTYKPLITEKWRKILKPGGRVITTAMIGRETTQERRDYFAAKAKMLATEHSEVLFPSFVKNNRMDDLYTGLENFAQKHTRHMLKGAKELKKLFSNFKNLGSSPD